MVVAKVRKVGAIGIFYWLEFPDVDSKESWFAKYSCQYELLHFAEGTSKNGSTV